MLKPKPEIAAMAPYATATLTIAPGKRLISLSQNESAMPASPLAIEAARAACMGMGDYPDSECKALREAIAEVHNLDPAGIVCGNGSMELIAALIAAYAGPGDEVLTTEYAYAFLQTSTLLAGAQHVAAPEQERTTSVDALLEAVTAATRIVCVVNPANPTGTRIARSEIVRLRESLRDDVLLMVDEAYGEFSDQPEDLVFDLIDRGNVVVMRTFSKAYALAGVRAGWALCPRSVAMVLRKVLNPSNVSVVAHAAATAAMSDQAHMKKIVGQTIQVRDGFTTQLRQLGLRVDESHTNFVLIRFADASEAREADQCLRAEGIVMRGMAGYHLAHALRATIGSAADMEFAVEILRGWQSGS